VRVQLESVNRRAYTRDHHTVMVFVTSTRACNVCILNIEIINDVGFSKLVYLALQPW